MKLPLSSVHMLLITPPDGSNQFAFAPYLAHLFYLVLSIGEYPNHGQLVHWSRYPNPKATQTYMWQSPWYCSRFCHIQTVLYDHTKKDLMVGLKTIIIERMSKQDSVLADLQLTTFPLCTTLFTGVNWPITVCMLPLLISKRPMTVLIDVYCGVLLEVWAYTASSCTFYKACIKTSEFQLEWLVSWVTRFLQSLVLNKAILCRRFYSVYS